MRKFVIVYKPMFKKKYHIECHYFNQNVMYKKDILCGYEFINEIDAKIALTKFENEEYENV